VGEEWMFSGMTHYSNVLLAVLSPAKTISHPQKKYQFAWNNEL
jgi:hypothetical protein